MALLFRGFLHFREFGPRRLICEGFRIYRGLKITFQGGHRAHNITVHQSQDIMNRFQLSSALCPDNIGFLLPGVRIDGYWGQIHGSKMPSGVVGSMQVALIDYRSKFISKNQTSSRDRLGLG